MKITANRREDIEKQMAEYDAETNRLDETQKQQEGEYHSALYEQRKALESKISDIIGPTSLELSIRVDPYGSSRSDYKTWSLRVEANEGRKFEENSALSWNWEVEVDKDGNLFKDSGSWSGLKATTPEQIADLEESVRVIKLLNNTDWKEILSSPKAEYYDYVDKNLEDTKRLRRNERPKFEDELASATLEELIGSNTALKLTDDPYYNGNVWILPTGQTEKFIKGYVFPQYYIDKENMSIDDLKRYGERRVAKNKLARSNGKLVTLDI